LGTKCHFLSVRGTGLKKGRKKEGDGKKTGNAEEGRTKTARSRDVNKCST